jgi:AcrR family transcriptional regulator
MYVSGVIEMDKRKIKGQKTFDLIVHSALKLASNGGLSAITAGKLASEAGISKSSVFTHFPNIALVQEALFEALEDFQLNEIKTLPCSSVKGIIEVFEKMLFPDSEKGKLIEQFNRVFLSFYNEAMFNMEIRTKLNTYLNTTCTVLTEKIYECNDSIDDKIVIRTCTELFISFLDGIGLHLLTMNDTSSYKQAWKIQKEFIINTLTK